MILKNYEVNTGRRFDSGRPHRIFFVADLHGKCGHGEEEEILRYAREVRPDLIATGGDMIRCAADYDVTDLIRFYASLQAVAPVYAVDGNHETRVREDPVTFGPTYHRFRQAIQKAGVVYLDNGSARTEIDGLSCMIYGYVPPIGKYGKLRFHSLKKQEITDWIGRKERSSYGIFLTHNPAFADTYFSWGADLVLAGHYHGGLIRIGDHAVLSPYGFPFPRYGYGKYEKGSGKMIVTGGAGDHWLSLRIADPHEVVCIHLRGEDT